MILALAFLLVCWLLFIAPPALSAPVAWVLLGYLLVRAWPGVRADLAGLRGARLPRRRRGGAHL